MAKKKFSLSKAFAQDETATNRVIDKLLAKRDKTKAPLLAQGQGKSSLLTDAHLVPDQ